MLLLYVIICGSEWEVCVVEVVKGFLIKIKFIKEKKKKKRVGVFSKVFTGVFNYLYRQIIFLYEMVRQKF